MSNPNTPYFGNKQQIEQMARHSPNLLKLCLYLRTRSGCSRGFTFKKTQKQTIVYIRIYILYDICTFYYPI